MSDIIIYLHYLFSITCGECLLRNCDAYSSKFKARLNQMSDIIIYLHYLFSITCGECLLIDLRCVLIEIQSKTELVTVGPLILSSRNIERMSDIIIYLHYLFSITCGECLLRDLRCVLIEIQSKTELVTVGPLILSSRNVYCETCDAYSSKFKTRLNYNCRSAYIVVTSGRIPPLLYSILKHNKSFRILKE
ncbi:hypothetical protein V1477_015757 [Vespula maculifrons]|uniref:Uncharacterized protein n=1 Tax=Vespula maculifrons TaxID=7453 RepID=A0ABD2BB41_VESMC